MKRMSKIAAAATVVVIAALCWPSAASAATSDLLQADPASVSVSVPAPGESTEWEMAAKNVSDSRIPLTLVIEGESAVLFDGAAPLELTIRESGTGLVIVQGAVHDLVGRSIELPELAQSASYDIVGVVTLPREAGNEYQGASGTLDFRFSTMAETPAEGPARLAITGLHTEGLVMLGAGAVVLVVFGVIAVSIRKRKESRR